MTYTEATHTAHLNAQYRDSETQNVRDTLSNRCGVSDRITPSPPAGDKSNGGVAPPVARHAD
ncbi:hypothetical protein GCM10009037_29440 [Halarchaeum grantii]|uniref:Uncharacterized protein n=1 Tax=Halarchaeum grantii TaxID=1193105 RepID=A0A830EZ22_9EURY|nr:hypothetical protein GCM10009037_29440 [Halarchaeum grantii]